ncbi:MAG: sigma 54-interacting transcriptional regulator [Bryobacteraceae bacterium]|jgi:PAS domain S-box-containing protein
MNFAASQQEATWLVSDGLIALEVLFRAVLFRQSEPILIVDNDRHCLDASSGARQLFGLSMDDVIGHRIDDLIEPSFQPEVVPLWRAFLQQGQQEGILPMLGRDGSVQRLHYTAKSEVSPGRHALVLHNKSSEKHVIGRVASDGEQTPAWSKDYALLSLDAAGRVVAWYAGAQRIYGYKSEEIVGQHVSCLYLVDDDLSVDPQEELKRTATEGHLGNEGWHKKQDGSRFWANVLTTALRDKSQKLNGFAMVVRDFSGRHRIDEALLHKRRGPLDLPAESTIVGVVSGEFDHILEANDAFLGMLGYSREDLGGLQWADIAAPEYLTLEEFAHEEGLVHGASTPFEMEYIRKDETRVRVLVASAVLQPSPFRWISFVQDLTERASVETIAAEPERLHEFDEIVGTSAALKRVMGQVEIVAPTDATVLVLGETGTGKELVARAIHNLSGRRHRPFITLNCAAIPTGLLESELFGYERGAFTGALSQKIGRFERAHQGTLFLDEVGDIPLELQPKLLRALQEKEFERLGGTRTIPIDVRLLAATNRNLTQMMGDKLFRSDLYYRLKVFPITIPPLREHREDIPVLVRHFTQMYASKMDKQIDTISSETMQALVSWPWPGNVRELENFIERSVILSPGPNLRAPLAEIRGDAVGAPRSATLSEVEREHIISVLRESNGVVSVAAARLGLPRTTLNAMMRKLEISRKDF